LSPSRRQRSVGQAAQILAWVTAAALCGAALRTDPVEPATVLAAFLVAAAAVTAARSRRPPAIEIGVDRSGCIVVRPQAGSAESAGSPVQCIFAAPWLITLRRGTMWVAIWPDSFPEGAFRRFWVHVRWRAGRPPAGVPVEAGPGQPK
jgi:hypothetical protein